ncbi:hypothetical protein IE53DRAFT_185721 [Violaceomyces palustris]|uniref:Uncharacterized protein n=1 Tax=Violaceomyces palustris TaxID=1673888 RepID=A0ACD0NRZ2_9BASI|nr:hypothetical protein IE53DRAFT_185721 [Violaceomyces palustris]
MLRTRRENTSTRSCLAQIRWVRRVDPPSFLLSTSPLFSSLLFSCLFSSFLSFFSFSFPRGPSSVDLRFSKPLVLPPPLDLSPRVPRFFFFRPLPLTVPLGVLGLLLLERRRLSSLMRTRETLSGDPLSLQGLMKKWTGRIPGLFIERYRERIEVVERSAAEKKRKEKEEDKGGRGRQRSRSEGKKQGLDWKLSLRSPLK